MNRFTRLITGCAVLAITCASTSARAGMLTSLAGYWSFEGDGADGSGNGRDLVLYGSPGFGAGLLGQALSLDRDSSQYAARPVSDAVFNFGGGDFAIQVWMNLDAANLGFHQDFVSKTGIGSGWVMVKLDEIEQGGEPFGRVFRIHADGTTPNFVDSPPQDLTSGTWHHWITQREGNELTMWFDGELVATQTYLGSIVDSSNPLRIGARSLLLDPERNFAVDGRLDEIAIWNRALSQTEIAHLYNGGSGVAVPEASSATLACGALALILLARRCRLVAMSPRGKRGDSRLFPIRRAAARGKGVLR